MKLSESFEVGRDRRAVWEAFQDIPEVVKCLPGASLSEDLGEGRYRGAVAVKLGPMQPTFDGEATVVQDPASQSGRIEGKGVDKKGGSRARMDVVYRLRDAESGTGTRVEVEADFALSGRAAQFGRVGLIQEVTRRLLREFSSNLEAKLEAPDGAAAAAVEAGDLDAGAVLRSSLWAVIKGFWLRLLGRRD